MVANICQYLCVKKMPIASVGILYICNLWILLKKIVIYILSAEHFIFIDFFAVKVDGSDVNPGICLYEKCLQMPWVDNTSVKFNSKKVYENEIFGNKIYYNFSEANPKITNM